MSDFAGWTELRSHDRRVVPFGTGPPPPGATPISAERARQLAEDAAPRRPDMDPDRALDMLGAMEKARQILAIEELDERNRELQARAMRVAAEVGIGLEWAKVLNDDGQVEEELRIKTGRGTLVVRRAEAQSWEGVLWDHGLHPDQ